MTLNTYVAGEPASGHALADFLTRRADAVHDKATSWHDARKTAEADWDGPASEAFISHRVVPNGRDADALADIDRALARPFIAWSDGVAAAKDWMERAKQVARDGELIVLGHAIYPPKAFEHLQPTPLKGPVSPAERDAHAQAQADFDAAKAAHAKKQAAFAEAQGLVQHARDLERKAHDEFRDALTRQTEVLKQLGQFNEWSRVADSVTTPAAMGLMNMATDLENKSAHVTQAAFEKAAGQGPHATHSMWTALTSEQRADLISRHPQMVGSTNGIPAVDRDLANRSILDAQRQAIVNRLRNVRADNADAEHRHPTDSAKANELKEALMGIDKLRDKLGHVGSGYFLLDIDATAADRGQAVVTHGNPDKAEHVMTLVPGTFSDLGDVSNYVDNNDRVMTRANDFASGDKAIITWSGYESPNNIFPEAAHESYAVDAGRELSDFQEGLRATHEGNSPSHNVLVGHSYGSTTIGYTARDHGVAVDDIGFLGSPGVGVSTAEELGVGREHVWSGTAGKDSIDSLTPSIDWRDYFHTAGRVDVHHFGTNPSSPAFGANEIPTDPNAGHNDYWNESESIDGLARLMVNQPTK